MTDRVQLVKDIKDAVNELAEGRSFPDLIEAIDALAALSAGGDPWKQAEQRLADAGHVAQGQAQALTDDATKQQAADAVKRMNKARHFPAGTDACSRHVALMAETLAKGRPYPMLQEEREHCAISLAITVAMLWEARAALSHQAGQKEGA